MRPYVVFPHTADVGLLVRGKKLEELFSNAGLGITSLLTNISGIKPSKKITVRLASLSWEDLLVAWLEEILYFFTVKGMAFSKFKIEKLGDFKIKAQACGEKLDLKRHPVHREVKAVTYHDLRIEKTKKGYETRIILDI